MSWLRILSIAVGLGLAVLAIAGGPRDKLGTKSKWILACAGVVLVALGAVGTYAPRVALWRGWLILSGGLVDVGGYRLRIECIGAGKPTVVMDAGLAQDRSTWGQVPSGVAAFTRVCTYDRAGLGESEAGAKPRTSQQIVAELQVLLKRAGIQSPYLLVGHSFGGANVRLFASQHPDAVVGIVLVDASQEDQTARYAELMTASDRDAYLRHEQGENYEGVNVEASLEEVRASPLQSPIALTVLAATKQDPSGHAREAQLHDELQRKLADLVPHSKLIFVPDSGHFIQLDQPQVVIQAVHDMVDRLRQGAQSSRLLTPLRAVLSSVE